MSEYMITFPNTHSAILGERILLKQNVENSVMPLPSQISSGCGICLRIPSHCYMRAKELLAADNVKTDRWYRLHKEDGAVRYEEITDEP